LTFKQIPQELLTPRIDLAAEALIGLVDEDAPTQPVIITDPPEMPKRYAGVCMCNESNEFYDATEWNERCPVHGREARDAAKKMRAHDLEVAAALDQLLQGSTTLPAWGRRAITLACEKLRR
jgi:hypothetical protein